MWLPRWLIPKAYQLRCARRTWPPCYTALRLQDAAEDWSAGTMEEGLFSPPFAAHAIDPALYGSHPGEGAPVSGMHEPAAASGTICSDTTREAFDTSDHVADVAVADVAVGDVHTQETTHEYSLRGDIVDSPENPEGPPLDTCGNDEDTDLQDASRLSEVPMFAVEDGFEGGGFDADRVLAVFEVHARGQQVDAAETEGDGHCAEPFVAVHLYVGQLPDPTADDPATPPLAQNAVRIEDVFEIMQEQVQDPARGWGVLMSDVRKVLTPERFKENAGSRIIPPGYVTWPVFVRTVLHMLHR